MSSKRCPAGWSKVLWWEKWERFHLDSLNLHVLLVNGYVNFVASDDSK